MSSLTFFPDDRRIAVSDLEKRNIYILDSGTGSEISKIASGMPREYLLRDVCIDPTGEVLASCSDQTIVLWSLNMQKEVQQIRYADVEVPNITCIDFSPDGTRIASGGYDNSVRIWNILNGDQLLCLRGHAHYVYDIEWMRDGLTLISGGADSTIRIWDVNPCSQMYGSCLKILKMKTNCQGMQVIGACNISAYQLEFLMDRGAVLDTEQKNAVAGIQMQRKCQKKPLLEETDWRYDYKGFRGRGRNRILTVHHLKGEKRRLILEDLDELAKNRRRKKLGMEKGTSIGS